MLHIISNGHGNFANKLFRLAYARRIAELLGQPVQYSGFQIEELGFDPGSDRTGQRADLTITDIYTHPDDVALFVQRNDIGSIFIDTVVCDFFMTKYFGLVEDAFRLAPKRNDSVYDDDRLFINIRANEILQENIHHAYGPLPFDYYRYLQRHTQRELCFFGQVGDNAYADALRRAFPSSLFMDHISAKEDFAVLTSARNLAVSVSTFSWLGAFCSNADMVHIPLAGMYKVADWPHQDFLSLGNKNISVYKGFETYWATRHSNWDVNCIDGIAKMSGMAVQSLRLLSLPRRLHYRQRARKMLQNGLARSQPGSD